MICCMYFKVLKVFDVDVFGFQIELFVDILAFFDLATFWAILQKIWQFFSYHPVILKPSQT